jgi:hypothetical protein
MVNHIPEKWRDLRLEYTDEYNNNLREKRIKNESIPQPKVMKKPVSVLKNKSDVNKGSHRLKEERCISNKDKCVIL